MGENGVAAESPYEGDCMDRDTAAQNIQKYLLPNNQIRRYPDSLGEEMLAFCMGSVSQWEESERQLGKDKVAYYFASVRGKSPYLRWR